MRIRVLTARNPPRQVACPGDPSARRPPPSAGAGGVKGRASAPDGYSPLKPPACRGVWLLLAESPSVGFQPDWTA